MSSKRSHVERLVDLGLKTIRESFVDQHGDAIAKIAGDGPERTLRIQSSEFAGWLRALYREADRTLAPSGAIREAVEHIGSEILHTGIRGRTYVRVAGDETEVEVDLGGGRFIQITADGWKKTLESKYVFLSPLTAQHLPDPEPGGSLSEFHQLLRCVQNEADELMVEAAIVGLFRPYGPQPILLFEGEQGSGKSTSAVMFKKLVDPATPLLRGEKISEDDLMISSMGNWVLAFDNVSYLTGSQADWCCRMATGAGRAKRKLYTSAEETTFEALRALIFTSISPVTNRADFMDRCIRFRCPPPSQFDSRSERDLMSAFDEMLPRLLGAAFDAVARVLRNLPEVRLDEAPRMREFAEWGVAAHAEKGEFFLASALANRASLSDDVLSTNPVASVVIQMLAESRDGVVAGEPTKVYNQACDFLDRTTNSNLTRRDWPKSVVGFGQSLARITPDLRKKGIEVKTGTRGSGSEKTRWTTIVQVVPEEPANDEEIPF